MTVRSLWLAAFLSATSCTTQSPPIENQPIATQQPGAQPAQDPLLRERAAAAENLGRYAEAADHYQKLMQKDPLRAEWAIAAGRCLGRSGRFNDAIELLLQQRNAFPGVLDLTAMLARTFLLKAEGDQGGLNPKLAYEDAVHLAEEVLAIDANQIDAQLILAQARYGLGDFSGAASTAERAVQTHPKHAGAHVLAGQIAFDRFKQQKVDFAAISTPLIDAERAVLVTAIDAQRQRAKREFQAASELDPARTFAQISLAQIAVLDKELDAALTHWGEALRADPLARVDHAWIEQNVTKAQRLAFYQSTLMRYRKRTDADQKLAAGLVWYVARACFDEKQWAAARTNFEQVAADNREYTNAYYWAGLSASYQGDLDAAEMLLGRYAGISATTFADELRKQEPTARAELGQLVQSLANRAYHNNNLDNSRDLNHVVAALRDSADAWNNYAFLCRESGRFPDAVSAYEHALEKEPDSAQLCNDLAVVLQYHLPSTDNLVRAKQLYQQTKKLADQMLQNPNATELQQKQATQSKLDAQQNLAKFR